MCTCIIPLKVEKGGYVYMYHMLLFSHVLSFFQLRNAIQGRIDEEEAEKQRELESEDKEYDPQQLEIESMPHPSDYLLSHKNLTDFEYPIVQVSPPQDSDSNV